MEIKFTTKHGHLRENDSKYIKDKLNKLEHIFNRIESIEVFIDWENHEHHLVSEVKIKVDTEHKKDIVTRAHGKSMELRPAFDMAYYKTEQRLRKYKEKLVKHQ